MPIEDWFPPIQWMDLKKSSDVAITPVVFVTTAEKCVDEREYFAVWAENIIKEKRGNDKFKMLTLSGDSIEQACKMIGLPENEISLIVISPNAPHREEAIADARKKYPNETAAFDESKIKDRAYVFISLIPCAKTHTHEPELTILQNVHLFSQ